MYIRLNNIDNDMRASEYTETIDGASQDLVMDMEGLVEDWNGNKMNSTALPDFVSEFDELSTMSAVQQQSLAQDH